MRREAHILKDRPDLLWQQLYNNLQWADESVSRMLVPELARRCRPGGEPWIKNRSRQRESEALTRTLLGHNLKVVSCAISPDGSWIVSTSWDKTLRLWDAATGLERATLAASLSPAYAISPEGSFFVCT